MSGPVQDIRGPVQDISGPVQERDVARANEAFADIEARERRRTDVGGLPVSRMPPTKGRRTVGAWCFVDLMGPADRGPADAEEPDPMEVGPHPHIGLSTGTWLLDGDGLHSDSLGTQQVIRPSQLNLMTAGHGVGHAELGGMPAVPGCPDVDRATRRPPARGVGLRTPR